MSQVKLTKTLIPDTFMCNVDIFHIINSVSNNQLQASPNGILVVAGGGSGVVGWWQNCEMG
jgi:hypothetical protein